LRKNAFVVRGTTQVILPFIAYLSTCFRPVITETRVRFRTSTYEICGGENNTGVGIRLSVCIFPFSIIPPMFHSHLNLTNTLITRRIGRKL